MNNCQEIKDLILTDYIDGELAEDVKAQLELHLRQCASCQAFAKEAQENLSVPFQKLPRQTVPFHLWQNIRESIQQEQVKQTGPLDIVKGWLQGLSFPKLVPVFGSFVFMLLIGSQVLLDQQVKQAQNEEEVIYLASVLTPSGTGMETNSDYETSIEQYFL